MNSVPASPDFYELRMDQNLLSHDAFSMNSLRYENPAELPLPSSPASLGQEKQALAASPAVHPTPRVRRIWKEWLQALAADPEAALAAALAYGELDGAGREEWLEALDADLVQLGASNVAVYAPLLAVEDDDGRRARIALALNADVPSAKPVWQGVGALQARSPDGSSVAVLVRPLYLDFVQVLACGYVPGRCLLWVRHDPIASRDQTLVAGSLLDGLPLEQIAPDALIDELAQTVVAHTRQGGDLPEALRLFADLFGPNHAEYVAATEL